MSNPFIDSDECNTRNQEEANETFDPIEPLTEEDLQANSPIF